MRPFSVKQRNIDSRILAVRTLSQTLQSESLRNSQEQLLTMCESTIYLHSRILPPCTDPDHDFSRLEALSGVLQ